MGADASKILVKYMQAESQQQTEELKKKQIIRADKLFKMLDKDKNGTIDGGEINRMANIMVEVSEEAVAKRFGIRALRLAEVNEIIDKCDADNNRQIDVIEFSDLLHSFKMLLKSSATYNEVNPSTYKPSGTNRKKWLLDRKAAGLPCPGDPGWY